jgi:hypothetical protein
MADHVVALTFHSDILRDLNSERNAASCELLPNFTQISSLMIQTCAEHEPIMCTGVGSDSVRLFSIPA